jgi:shikimate 5-dehydrogenase
VAEGVAGATAGLGLAPAMYFVGVTATRSSINRIFPLWAKALGLGEARLVPVDLPPRAGSAALRGAIEAIASDDAVRGALVTTHKIDVFQACRDLFDELSADAEALGEVSCITKQDGRFRGLALDRITSGLAADAIVPGGHWRERDAELLLLGSGGSATALLCHYGRAVPGVTGPRRVVATSRSPERLANLRTVHGRLGHTVPLETIPAVDIDANDAALASMAPGSLIVNATGLGKDAPGSPISDAAAFPEHGIAWDFNYRGDLRFLDQARRQERQRQLQLEDGWSYFLHGWTRHIAAVFGIDPSVVADRFSQLAGIAGTVR